MNTEPDEQLKLMALTDDVRQYVALQYPKFIKLNNGETLECILRIVKTPVVSVRVEMSGRSRTGAARLGIRTVYSTEDWKRIFSLHWPSRLYQSLKEISESGGKPFPAKNLSDLRSQDTTQMNMTFKRNGLPYRIYNTPEYGGSWISGYIITHKIQT